MISVICLYMLAKCETSRRIAGWEGSGGSKSTRLITVYSAHVNMGRELEHMRHGDGEAALQRECDTARDIFVARARTCRL